MNNKLEPIKITWKEAEIIKEVGGFLLSEKNNKITISSTIGTRELLDKTEINHDQIIERKGLIC